MHIVGVYSPTPSHAGAFAKRFGCTVFDQVSDVVKDADLVLLCVPDDRIGSIAGQIPVGKAIVAHTSGITGIDRLNMHERYGVFYPLQTFSSERAVDMRQVPFCLEAS